MNYQEATLAISFLPESAWEDVLEASTAANRYWSECAVRKDEILAARAAAIELSLIASGALSILENTRDSSNLGITKLI